MNFQALALSKGRLRTSFDRAGPSGAGAPSGPPAFASDGEHHPERKQDRMTDTPQPFNRAERVFGTPIERAEKGSAMSMIRAEVDARNAKSERLRAMRLAQEAARQAPVAAPRKTTKAKGSQSRIAAE
jgi:N-methylhydantoinase A/oxoprolinase/acetone carboxylase beta subunit